VGLRNRWVAAFYRAATGNRRARSRLTPWLVIAFVGFIWLLVFLSRRTDSFLGLPGLLPVPLNTILFVPLLTLGLLLIVWSIVHFARVRGTPIPSIPPPRLVTTGPYAYARNPMHTGIYILLFGLGVLFRSVSLVAIFLPLFVLLDVLELKKIEETELERRLGSEYLEYKKRVPMFFPRLKGKGAS
jgi:protein-S-isoprenylcysteine O-methyltransferase Ste14